MEEQCCDMIVREQLPSVEDLTPITQSLISPQLAITFGITPEPSRTMFDLNVVTHTTCSTKCPKEDNFQPLSLFPVGTDSGSSKLKRVDSGAPDESNSGSKDDNGDDTGLSRAVKRPRLVWTPQLHKRFVDVIEHLGIDKAVPKTIMEVMNVEGLTRENVASHLQKYRLYLKRMEGVSGEAHLSPRRTPTLFDCDRFSPIPLQRNPPLQSLHCNGLPYVSMPVPMVGHPSTGPYGLGPGHMSFHVGSSPRPGYCGLESGAYNFFWNRQRG